MGTGERRWETRRGSSVTPGPGAGRGSCRAAESKMLATSGAGSDVTANLEPELRSRSGQSKH